MLLATVGGVSLAQLSTMEQKNCNVNVIDVRREAMSSQQYRTLRVNEKRHLAGLLA